MTDILAKLRGQRAILVSQARELIATADSQSQSMKNKRVRFDALLQEIDSLDGDIQRAEKILSVEESSSFSKSITTGRKGKTKIVTDNHAKLVEQLRARGKTTDRLNRIRELQDYKGTIAETPSLPPLPPPSQAPQKLPRYSFQALLPLRVSDEAKEFIKKTINGHKVKSIEFPTGLTCDGKNVYYMPPRGKKKLLSMVRIEIIEDAKLMNIRNQGVVVRKRVDKNQLDFIFQYPDTPNVIQSPASKNQGDLSYRLRSTVINPVEENLKESSDG